MIRSQNLIPLTGGAYQARNKIADYEVCENLFPEINPQSSAPPVPVTHYPREGQKSLSVSPSPGVGRGLYTASNGQLWACVGSNVYYIDASWNWTLAGSIQLRNLPVSMSDDGTNLVLVDGTSSGYQASVSGGALTTIQDPTGTFLGSNRVDFSDTFFVFATPGTNQVIVSNPNSIAFDALQTANKDSKPDPIVSVAFNLRVMWLIGAQSSEVWWLAGSAPFPYQEFPNVFIPYGIAGAYSLVQADVDLFWLSRNEQGQAIAVKTKGYGVEAVSTRALEYEWSTYTTVADCIGGTFQQAGHTFVAFHFPSADKTWVYDLSTQQWHRRTWLGTDGKFHRDRVSFYASVGPQGGYPSTIVGQDWQTGQIYALDPQTYTDNGTPIVCRRSFPHQMADMREITHTSLTVDFATGGAQSFPALAVSHNFTLNGPALSMRYSKDGGSTWSSYRQKGLTYGGDYRSMMRFRGLGMGRDWVFEVMFVYPGPCALQGAYAEVIEHST